MPGYFAITSNFFVNLITRLGVRPPPVDGFSLVNTIQPISIVDADIAIPAVVTPPLFNTAPFTAGRLTNPAVNTIIADTGQLAVGNWAFLIMLAVSDTSAPDILIEHRDAANASNIWSQSIFADVIAAVDLINRQYVIAKSFQVNERLRLRTNVGSGVSSAYHANIFALQLS